jgi:hypothetical protein
MGPSFVVNDLDSEHHASGQVLAKAETKNRVGNARENPSMRIEVAFTHGAE